eukprot:8890058-Pyramimonas_sp.AAC.1
MIGQPVFRPLSYIISCGEAVVKHMYMPVMPHYPPSLQLNPGHRGKHGALRIWCAPCLPRWPGFSCRGGEY